ASGSREYSGVWVSETPWLRDFARPEIIWWPSIAPSGLTFYTGEHFPAWHGSLFVGAMRVGRMPHTGRLERIAFNRQGQEIGREGLLAELRQRIRDVRQGPDGFLYVLTDEDDAVLLRIEPAHAITGQPGSIVPAVRLTQARVQPLPEAEWTAEQRAIIEKYAPDGNPGNALRTLVRVPALADRLFPVLQYVAQDSTLSPRHRAMLILRTAWLTQNANLWATHASRASEAGLTQEQVPERVGRERSTVANYLRLLKLSRGFQEDLIRGRLTMGHARAMLALKTEQEMEEVRREVLSRNMNVRQLEFHIQKKKSSEAGPRPRPSIAQKDIFIKDLEKELQRHLGTKVAITPAKKGGKLVVLYYSIDDLNRIRDMIIK
ncbi:MAG: PQQ-dependent sugar dehydrogenase, partial [Nitrospinae bacterium]|nr:PQQ-dependent sugar dehydrogenase [Nitrospinota bacterium]